MDTLRNELLKTNSIELIKLSVQLLSLSAHI